MKRIGVGTKISIGFAACLLLMLLVGFLGRQNARSLLVTAARVSESQQIIQGVTEVNGRLRESEASMRGFALTGKNEMLTRYAEVRPALTRIVRSLHVLTANHAGQAARLDALVQLIERKLSFQDDLEAARRIGGLEKAVWLADTGEGFLAMEDILATTARMEEIERALLSARHAEAARSVERAELSITLALLVAVVLVLAIGTLIARDIALRVQQRDALIGASRAAVQHLSSASAELLAAASQQTSGASEQAASIAQTATAAEQVAKLTGHTRLQIEAVVRAAQRAATESTHGRDSADATIGRIVELRERVVVMAKSIAALAQKADGIRALNASVDEVAEVSHLLALNASIEAGRAGEHGRGFAVVASEVAALAKRSRDATREVRGLLKEMQGEAERAARAAEGGTESAEVAVRAADASSALFERLSRTVEESAAIARSVAESSVHQERSVTQIEDAMRDLRRVTEQGLAATRQIEAASTDLDRLSRALRETVSAEQ